MTQLSFITTADAPQLRGRVNYPPTLGESLATAFLALEEAAASSMAAGERELASDFAAHAENVKVLAGFVDNSTDISAVLAKLKVIADKARREKRRANGTQ